MSRHLSVLKLLVASVLVLLAYATNFALLVFTGPLLFLLMVFRKEDRARIFQFGLLNGAAIVAAYVHSKRMKLHATQFGVAPSLDALEQAGTILHKLLNVPVVVALLVLTVICLLRLPLAGERRRTLLLGLSAPVISALMMAVVLSMTVWVQINGFNVRYFLTAEIALATVMAYVLVSHLEYTGVGNLRAGATLVAIYVLLLLGPMGGFTDSYQELISEDRRVQSKVIAKAAVEARSTVIVGDFWDVWPVVYETQRLRHDDARPLPIFGAAQRASMLGREFRALAGTGAEQHALCFLPTADACMVEVRDRLQIAPDTRVETLSVAPLTLADKPMLNIGFRLAPVKP
jgi:hypothetical protein